MSNATTSSGFEIQALGPLTVHGEGVSADLGGPKQRLVLALLIVDIDRVVTTDRLIDGLWGDDPPPTARKAVQVHVSNLRRALGDGFPLRTAPGGYILQSADLDVDAVTFERELDAATAMLRTDPLGTDRMLLDAIGRWRGAPYADLGDEPALRAEIARLDELRLRALEVRLDGQLRVGRHAESVGELTTLCAEHPYRERFAELLMLALYRSGRQTEALRAFDRTRSVLVEELGVEPGPDLRALHEQILQQSAELDLDETDAADRYAFLATDIEGSTDLWEGDPDAMQDAVARHDQILADAVAANAGTVFKNTGDGIFAVFASASDALQAGVDAQQALHAEPWSTARPILVRMGVDEGAASARGDDYFGPALNRVSRVMSSGHGMQLLCPAELAPQAPVPTRSLGDADYKGIGRLEVAQLDVPGLPHQFPDLQTHRAPKTVVRAGFGRAIRGYELRERLGEGAHGVVYRAYQPAIGREVAIKVIRPDHANRAEFVKRFEAEAQFVAQLEHPHIVSLYDYWRDPDGAYLVMQLLRGGSLASSLERAPWRPPAALALLDQVGGALDYAHRQGVIHRDLKPANVLLDGEGNAYLSDFGIAAQHIDAVGAPIGSSVAYVSPEELAGAAVGPTADVYGLALLTNEILTGERPPLGEAPTPLSERRSELSPAVDAVIARAADGDPTRRFDRVDDFLRALRQAFGADVVTSPRRTAPSEVRNPYKGLRAFGEVDAHDFFGREALVSELVEHVSTHRFTAVVGPSGSGKSSLVRAGLLPALRRRAASGPGDVLITDMFPGSFPFEELEAALLRVAIGPQDGLLGELVADDRGLLRMSKQLLPDDDSELVLVIDQFEELFLLTHDDETRRRFLASLVTVAADERSRVRLVVTLRADHFDRPLADPEFGGLLRTNLVPIAMPSHDELSRAISQPAAGAGLVFEAGLIPRIVGDVADEPGALPLLQYALTELVRTRAGAELTMATYEGIGGVSGALTARADEIHDGLSPTAQDATREVFLRLVAVDETGDDTRRRVRRSELDALGLGESALTAVLDGFGSFRLLTFDHDPVTRGPTVEVAHEALIREWPRLREWIDERREDLLLERRLEAASQEWDINGREPSFLFAGGQLDQYAEWARTTDVRLTELERDYLDESRRADDEAATARRRRRRSVMAALGLFAVVASVAALVAVRQRNTANENADRAEAEAAAAEEATATAVDAQRAEETARLSEVRGRAVSDARGLALQASEVFEQDPDAGLLLAIAASDLVDSADADLPEVMEALFETATRHRPLLRVELPDRPGSYPSFGVAPDPRVSPAPDGGRLVHLVESDEGGTAARIVDLETRALLRHLDQVVDPVSVFWDPHDDRILVGADGVLAAVDPETGERTDLVQDGRGEVLVMGASPDHITYVVASTSVVIARDDASTVAEFADTHWARLSPTGDHVVLYRKDLQPWVFPEIETFPGGEPVEIPEDVAVFDWTADGDFLVMDPPRDPITDARFAIEQWSVDGTQVRQVFTTGTSGWPDARLSPDGRWIAIDAGGQVDIYDAGTLEQVEGLVLRPVQTEPQSPLTWSSDSRRLITVEANEALVWDMTAAPGSPGAALTGGARFGVAFFSQLENDRLLLGMHDGAWEIWNTRTGELEQRKPGDASEALTAIAVSPDGKIVASPTGPSGAIRVDDLETGDSVEIQSAGLGTPLAVHPGQQLIAAATSDTAIFGGSIPSVGLVSVESGVVATQLAQGFVRDAQFSPDGRIVVFAVSAQGESQDVRLPVLDSATGDEVARLEMPGGATGLGFSPDGRRLAVAGRFGVIELHDVDALVDGRESLVTRASTGREDRLSSPVFSADGAVVLAGEPRVRNDPFSRVTAWSADTEMQLLWSLRSDRPTGHLRMPITVDGSSIRDGLVWMPAGGWLPAAGSVVENGIIGIPVDRSEFAAFARQKPTRDLTELECESYFRSSCAEFTARIS
ncbi:MAG: protein kinase [Acidimicrobiia bacterium]|nr:protein kinase [Acidimicrobiia bacterium]